MYKKVHEKAKTLRSQMLTHYDFLLAIAVAWVDKDEQDTRAVKRRHLKRSNPSETPTAVNKRQCTPQSQAPDARKSAPAKTPAKAPRINDRTLCPSSGTLRHRLHHYGCFHCPVVPTSKSPSCALHRYLMGRNEGSHS